MESNLINDIWYLFEPYIQKAYKDKMKNKLINIIQKCNIIEDKEK